MNGNERIVPSGSAELPALIASQSVSVQSPTALLWHSLPNPNSVDPIEVCVLYLQTQVLEIVPLLYNMSTISDFASDEEQELKTPCHRRIM